MTQLNALLVALTAAAVAVAADLFCKLRLVVETAREVWGSA